MEYNKFLSRKFLFAVGVVLGNFGLMGFKLISDGVYSAVAIATIGAYLATNYYAGKSEAEIEASKVAK